MSFEPRENEVTVITLGDGNVAVKGFTEGLRLSDLGQACPIGHDLSKCDLPAPDERFVEISGTCEGLRVLASALHHVLAYRAQRGDHLPQQHALHRCACCGNRESLVDFGSFDLCTECMKTALRPRQYASAEEQLEEDGFCQDRQGLPQVP